MDYPTASEQGITKRREQNAPRGTESNPEGLKRLAKVVYFYLGAMKRKLALMPAT